MISVLSMAITLLGHNITTDKLDLFYSDGCHKLSDEGCDSILISIQGAIESFLKSQC